MGQIRTAATVGGGAAFGNGIAYFLIWYMGYKYDMKFDDPELALAMGGAVVATVILQVTRFFSWVGRGIVYVFNRVFPENKPKPTPPEENEE